MARMKRNANGSGSIYKREDGRWEGKYSIPAADGSGKYVRKSVYGKTQDEVRKKITEITAEIDDGTYVNPSQYKLSGWIDNWLEVYVKHSVMDFTYDSYSNICHKYIIPAIGKCSSLKPPIRPSTTAHYASTTIRATLSAITI